MGISITVNTKDLDGPGYSDWMIVCYKIHNPDGFKKFDRLGVDVPGDTQFMPPERAAKIDGAPKYEVDDKGPASAGLVTAEGQQDVEICFVVKKGPMREGQLSLELNRPRPLGGDQYERGRWERLPYDGGLGGIGTGEVPPAIAMVGSDDNPEHAMLADGTLAALASRRVVVSMPEGFGTQMRRPRKAK